MKFFPFCSPAMNHPAMLAPFPVECTGVVAEAGTAGGGATGTKPWIFAAGALVVGVTAAAAVAWHSASADADLPDAPPAAQQKAHGQGAGQVAKSQAQSRKSNDPAPATASICHDCGTVQSVQTITQKGEGSGMGAAAGAVVGGVLGHQVGKGQGNTAMTVLGAIGGGMAGNEVEKRAKASTHYRVTLKMEDGSTQVVDHQSQAPAVGQRMRIEGQKLVALGNQG